MDRAKLEEAITEFKKWGTAGPCGFNWRAVADAASAHLATLPQTKMIEVWRVEWVQFVEGIYEPCARVLRSAPAAEQEADYRRSLCDNYRPRNSCIRVTGPHRHEVPA